MLWRCWHTVAQLQVRNPVIELEAIDAQTGKGINRGPMPDLPDGYSMFVECSRAVLA